MEQLIQVINSTDFLNDWAFFITGLTSITGSNRLINSLEASYDQFDESLFGQTKNWQVACDGFFDHSLPVGYLRPSINFVF